MTIDIQLSKKCERQILEDLVHTVPENKSIPPVFLERFNTHFPTIFEIYSALYSDDEKMQDRLSDLFRIIYRSWHERDDWLKKVDLDRIHHRNWFQENSMLGGVCYVDLFSGNLKRIKEKTPYFKELGINYLHLMPFYKTPASDNDGGYAVSSYRQIDQTIGSIGELKALCRELKRQNISTVADFVINHTSDEHEWAARAKLGEKSFTHFYYMFDDRSIPDEYEKTLREIFPAERQGSFTFYEKLDKWVWTTFHSFQWDLNYSNPEVFNAMAGEMLFLANCGIDILRLDAVAFIWKEMGTSCENLPQAHSIIKAFNAICRIAAPALIFKSEAIVHPDEVKKYIHPDECQLSYNPLLMAVLWTCLASQEVRLLNVSMRKRFEIHPHCAWVNYIRCHDDIGWTFDDTDAQELHIHPYFHRQWLNEFYSGIFEGSFSSGLLFQENLKTGDARISGTAASLAGLEKALAARDEDLITLAIKRILLLHGIIMTIGGIPLIYLGDEIGQLNDYGYQKEPGKAKDSRWVHRPKMDWQKYELRNSDQTVESRIFKGLKKLIDIRKSHKVLSGNEMQVIDTANDHIFGFMRRSQKENYFVFSNFSPSRQNLSMPLVDKPGNKEYFSELITGTQIPVKQDYVMQPYQQIIIF